MSDEILYRDAIERRMLTRLSAIYGKARAPALLDSLLARIGKLPPPTPASLALSARDVVLITYGDQVRRAGETPLATLDAVLRRTVAALINTVHILPFYPYSSDDGFSVIDYSVVDPALGTWDDVTALGGDFRLMFDAVFNHISAQSTWFQGFLRGDPAYADFFIVTDPATDLSLVTRPRALPLLSAFETSRGTQHVWTTFSDDQIDLNFANPDVLLAVVDVLLFYVAHGAALIRLDAIAFLWKRPGTTCLHLPETHAVIKLMRDVLDLAAPDVIVITETNVPHVENISYFGDGGDEAQMVYQFPLPPLILHTFRAADARALSRWTAALEAPTARTTYFNFTASHDGIGLRPTQGLLVPDDIDALVALTTAHGGFVSYKGNSDGSKSPYELNITYFDAITDPALTARAPETAVARFLASQAIMLAFAGVPGIYFHSLFGSRNFRAGVEQTGRSRSINREKLDADALLAELADETSIRARVFQGYAALLRARTGEPAFDPLGTQTVVDFGPALFALERTSADGGSHLLALTNVTGDAVTVPLPDAAPRRDLLGGGAYAGSITLAPYQVAWLIPA